MATDRPFRSATVRMVELPGTTSAVTAPSDRVADTARIGTAEAMPDTNGASPMPPASMAPAFSASISMGAPGKWLQSSR